MGYNDEMQVIWIDTDGGRHETEFYSNADLANDKATEIVSDHRPIWKIWLQGRERIAGS